MMKLSCGNNEFILNPSNRDSHILGTPDPFMTEASDFYCWLIDPGNPSVVHGYEKDESWKRDRYTLVSLAKQFINKLEADSDLLSNNYQFSFTGNSTCKRPQSSGVAGFKIDGLSGSISSYPRSFLTLTLSERVPGGRGRIVRYIDMRNLESMPTDNWGDLRVHKKAAEFMLLDHMKDLHQFLSEHDDDLVTVTPNK